MSLIPVKVSNKLVLDIISMVWSLNNQNCIQAANMKTIPIPRHSLSTSSERRPNRTLEKLETSKTWLLTLREVLQEQLKPGVYRYGTKSCSLFCSEQESDAAVSGFAACHRLRL